MLKSDNVFKYTMLFILLVILQVTVFNKVSLFHYGTPYIYIYLIIKLPIALNRNWITLIGFVLGFTIDIFCNTPGINAAATTLIAFMRRPIQNLFFAVEDYEENAPKLSIQKGVFIKWVILIIFIHHSILLSLEWFSLFNFKYVFIRILLSTILTCVLVFAFEGFSQNKRRL